MEGLRGVERTLLLYVSLLFGNKDEFIRKFYGTINIRGSMGNCSDFNPVCAIGPTRLIVLKRWTTALNVRGDREDKLKSQQAFLIKTVWLWPESTDGKNCTGRK